jgi:hypothetical protein
MGGFGRKARPPKKQDKQPTTPRLPPEPAEDDPYEDGDLQLRSATAAAPMTSRYSLAIASWSGLPRAAMQRYSWTNNRPRR